MISVRIFCKNTGKHISVDAGASLYEIAEQACKTVTDPKTGTEYKVLAALVDNKLKALDFTVFHPHEIEFIGYNHPDGRRTYIRSLAFMLQNAVRKLYPGKILVVDHSLPSGLYCEILDFDEETGETSPARPVVPDLEDLKQEMKNLASRDLRFTKKKLPTEEGIKLFEENRQYHKARLEESLGRFFLSVYYLDGHADTFHGPLVYSTGVVKVFNLVHFGKGFCLQYPLTSDPSKVIPYKEQSKVASSLEEYSTWCRTIGILGVGTLNNAVLNGRAIELINISEARMERQYAALADKIFAEKARIRIVFIAGPSSSGKTSSALRIAQQCKVLGMNPKVIELDNYFVSRQFTPRDEDGNFDFECLEAMDLKLLNDHLNALLAGEKVELPRFDFMRGEPVFEGNFMQLEDNDILIMEGIHALDPAMVPEVDNSRIFRVYASALTSLNLDENNNISTTDNRILRRMVRDYRFRGHTPENTITGWKSVRRGEEKYIFPFQEYADAQINTALMYELPLLKYYAEPLLRRITPNSPAYSEAVRLLKFLDYIVALQPNEIAAIPPTSIMREFIGGQTL
ncbi:MAG: nucleoside kinase [Bacteroidota bacterium]|nr:nucleoside kinase [Bacteroidota bacterium]